MAQVVEYQRSVLSIMALQIVELRCLDVWLFVFALRLTTAAYYAAEPEKPCVAPVWTIYGR